MSRKRKIMIVCIAAALLVMAGAGAYAATNYGSTSDPLITKSYLDQVLTPNLNNQFRTELNTAVKELESSSGTGSDTYTLLTLSSGQSVKCSVGTEILLRIGTAKVLAADSPGLVDTSTAGSINNGASLSANHLYLVTIEGHGFTATAPTVKILVKGSYTIG